MTENETKIFSDVFLAELYRRSLGDEDSIISILGNREEMYNIFKSVNEWIEKRYINLLTLDPSDISRSKDEICGWILQELGKNISVLRNQNGAVQEKVGH